MTTFVMFIVIVANVDLQKREFQAGYRPLGVWSSKLECEKAAEAMNRSLPKGSTSLCAPGN